MRWVRRAIYLALALAIVAFGAGWYLLAGSLPQLDGQLDVDGLSAPVQIQRDALGTVTIEAANRRDLAWATGFVHGQVRFFQMDLQRRVAAGELAELLGPMALEVDLDHRRHRLRARAEHYLAERPAHQAELLRAYASGVNAGLAHLDVRPWEYLLLGQQPEAWQPADTLLTLDAMFFSLNGGGDNDHDLAITRMRAVLPGKLVDFLLAPAGRWAAPLQGEPFPPPEVPTAAVFDLRQAEPASAASVDLPEPEIPGSNNFAVAGALTGGAAIVANDMHLGLRVPDIWMRMRLRYHTTAGERVELNGVTLPGTPAMVAGTNGDIAWGFTNSYGDWMDWAKVRFDPEHPNRYRTTNGWAEIREHTETIRVAGGEPHKLVVRDTIWGPIMATAPDGTPLALAWIAHSPRSHNFNILKLEQTRDVATALAIAPTIGMPPQNFLVGDAQGHIGWTITGNALPLRAGYNPNLPADWSRPHTGWVGWAEPAQFPRIINPASGRLWTANNRTTSGAWLKLLGDGGYALGARAQQIRDDLFARQHFQPEDLLAIQLDNRAVFLTRWQKLLQTTLKAHPDAGLGTLQQLTADWTGRAAADSVDYRLVRNFRNQVGEAVLAPFITRVEGRFEDFEWPSSSEAAVWTLLQQRPPWLLGPDYASWDALLLHAAHEVVDELGDRPGGLAARTWGERNRADIHHPLAPALPWPLDDWLSMPPDPLPGDNHMPRVLAPSFGASERFGIQPGNLEASYLEMPGGQSGNPLSPFFGAGHEAWVHGQPTPLLPGPAKHTLQLQPDPM